MARSSAGRSCHGFPYVRPLDQRLRIAARLAWTRMQARGLGASNFDACNAILATDYWTVFVRKSQVGRCALAPLAISRREFVPAVQDRVD